MVRRCEAAPARLVVELPVSPAAAPSEIQNLCCYLARRFVALEFGDGQSSISFDAEQVDEIPRGGLCLLANDEKS
jgi:hypothetical protein